MPTCWLSSEARDCGVPELRSRHRAEGLFTRVHGERVGVSRLNLRRMGVRFRGSIMPDGPRQNGPRYDDDFFAWTQYQAEVLRSVRTRDNRFDREQVAEEIEDLGKNERDTMESQIRRVMEHFLKLAYSPADPPRYGWMGSISDARRILRKRITPTLRRHAEQKFAELYEDAREAAELALRDHGEHEAAAALPLASPYKLEQVPARV